MTSARFLIYGLVDPRTLLVRYVGKSSSGMRRPRAHKYRLKGTHRAHWVRSLLGLGLMYEIVILESVESAELLNESECWWIAYGHLSCWPLTNHTEGGEGTTGYRASAETRAKLSALHKGRIKSPETRALLAEVARRWIRTPEIRAKMAASARKRPPISESTSAKISEVLRQRERSPKSIAALTSANHGRVFSAETRAKIGEATRKRLARRRGDPC